MTLGDPARALRAQAELAVRHARELQEEARVQRARALAQRDRETRAVEAARAAASVEQAELYCARCDATWSGDAVREAMRRRPGCLLCGGPLSPVP